MTMKKPLAWRWLAAAAVLFSVVEVCQAAQPPVSLLARADVVPLALEPGAFEFRKEKLFFLESVDFNRLRPTTEERSIAFERKRLLFGAVTPNDERDRYGNYFTFYWRTRRAATLVIRLEYRQARLGPFVQAREVSYAGLRPGTHRTDFQVTGDDYQRDGRVSAWRALLIERDGPPSAPGGRIVALTQSALWR